MTVSIPPAQAEQSETAALHEIRTPAHTRASPGIETARIGGGAALSMRNDPTGFWSKALGFGFHESVTVGLIAEVCEFYRSQGTPVATIQLAPSVIPEYWPEICAKRNLQAGSSWHKLACATAEWASVVIRGFEMPNTPGARRPPG
jgi:hypothetical protein